MKKFFFFILIIAQMCRGMELDFEDPMLEDFHDAFSAQKERAYELTLLENRCKQPLPIWGNIPKKGVTFHPKFIGKLKDALGKVPDKVLRSDYIHSIAYCPNSIQLASVCGGGTIKLWDLQDESDQPIKVLWHGGSWVLSIAYHPNGIQLASGCEDETIKLWDLQDESDQPIKILQHGGSWVLSVAYHPNGIQLASSSRVGTIKLWDQIQERIGFGKNFSHAQYDLLRAIQELFLLQKYAKARKRKPIEPIVLNSDYTSVFKSYPNCVQKALQKFVILNKACSVV